MYNKIPNGTKVDIQGLQCWIPPLGHGIHSESGEIGRCEILKRSDEKKEQYWERPVLPDDFEDLVDEESEMKKKNPDFVDNKLQKIREREWRRRMYGVWFYNNGKPVYLTGLNYYFLTYWELDTDYPDFREIDVEYFYFWQYCVEDPTCYGMIEVRKRRDGKSYRAGCMITECISRVKKALGGIQSKTEDDAQEFFETKIVPQFQTLPSFFRPIWDTSSGQTPKGELRFFRPSRKGAAAKRNLTGDDLKSKIDFRNSKMKAYDGAKTKRLILDESGKVAVDVIKRHGVVKHCCVDNKRNIIGKILVTSTCEEIGIEFRFDALWQWSDQNNREKNGRSKSGLYQFFMPADRSGDYDKYGVADRDGTLAKIMDGRQALINEPTDYIDEVRKEPLTITEAFKMADTDCVFDFMSISDRQDQLAYTKNLVTRGDFEWKDGIANSSVYFTPNKMGKWYVSHLLPEGESNKVIKYGSTYKPDNKVNFCAGADPFDINKTKDKKGGSRGTVYVKWRFSVHNQDNENNNNLIVRYANRPKLSNDYYEDVLKTIWYYGCELLAERNKYGLVKWMVGNGYHNFLIWLKGEVDYGIYASTDTNQELTRVTKDFIGKRIHVVRFPELLGQWIKFDPSNTQPYDEAMAAGYALMADTHHIPAVKHKQTSIKRYVRSYAV